MTNLLNFLANPLQGSIKKYVYELIGGDRYLPHEQVIEQLGRNLDNMKGYEDFGKFIAEIYEAGYMRAVTEHETELKRIGLNVTIKRIEKKAAPIFNQKNPADPQ